MRAGIDVGPLWVSTDEWSHRHHEYGRRRPWGAVRLLLFGILLLAGAGINIYALTWALWSLAGVLLVLVMAQCNQRKAAARAPVRPAPPRR